MKYLAGIIGLFFLSSCATVLRGTHDKLRVESEPAGANVALSSGERGLTPTTFKKRRTDQFLVTISKTGYQSQLVTVESRFSASGGAAALGNALAGGIIGAVVDGTSGATKSLYPNPVSVVLIPNRGRSSARAAAPAPTPTKVPTGTPAPARQNPRPVPAPTKIKTTAPRFRTDKYGTQYLDPGR